MNIDEFLDFTEKCKKIRKYLIPYIKRQINTTHLINSEDYTIEKVYAYIKVNHLIIDYSFAWKTYIEEEDDKFNIIWYGTVTLPTKILNGIK